MDLFGLSPEYLSVRSLDIEVQEETVSDTENPNGVFILFVGYLRKNNMISLAGYKYSIILVFSYVCDQTFDCSSIYFPTDIVAQQKISCTCVSSLRVGGW